MTPQRIQRRRTRGWRMPENAVYVGRPSKWGNPWKPGDQLIARINGDLWICPSASTKMVVDRYLQWLQDGDDRAPDGRLPPDGESIVRELAGRDLARWCPASAPCHADVLLAIANAER